MTTPKKTSTDYLFTKNSTSSMENIWVLDSLDLLELMGEDGLNSIVNAISAALVEKSGPELYLLQQKNAGITKFETVITFEVKVALPVELGFSSPNKTFKH